MVRLLTILAILFTTFMLVSAPYLAALSYTTVSVMQPHHIFFWSFDGIPIFKITAGLSIVAWMIQAFRNQIDWSIYQTGQFKAMVILVFVMHLSSWFSPFQDYYASVASDIVLDVMRVTLIMYFVVLGLIQNKKALTVFCYTMVVIAAYYTYWTNMAYIRGDWSNFVGGRFAGPGTGPYRDGNVFSILLVVLMPFILFGIFYFKNKFVKASLILLLPLLWHALILCASRGALLSAGFSTLFAATLIRSKSLNIMLLAGFFVALVTQGGALVSRSVSTIQASQAGSEEPLNPRLVSWQVGAQLALKYPILGAGPQRFQMASNAHFPGKSPHVAHNTFLNFAANTGLLAGLIYLYFFFKSYKDFKRVKKSTESDSIYAYINNASMCGLVGFFIGALFLDMIIFEPFYFMILLISVNHLLCMKESTEKVEATA